MTREEKITRIRELLASAGSIRTPHSNALGGLDEALARARTPREHVGHMAPYPIRRRRLLFEVSKAERYYGLRDEVETFSLGMGVDTVHGLGVDALEALVEWLNACMEMQHVSADWRHGPAAR